MTFASNRQLLLPKLHVNFLSVFSACQSSTRNVYLVLMLDVLVIRVHASIKILVPSLRYKTSRETETRNGQTLDGMGKHYDATQERNARHVYFKPPRPRRSRTRAYTSMSMACQFIRLFHTGFQGYTIPYAYCSLCSVSPYALILSFSRLRLGRLS